MDISWIIEQEKLEKIQKKCIRESLSTIELVSIYVNREMEMETIEKETMELDGNILTAELLKEWCIQKQKHTPTSIFELYEILWFHIDLEPEQIQENHSYLKTLGNGFEPIIITPSIFIFHSLTTLFLIFEEKESLKPTLKIDRKKQKHTLRIVVPSKYKKNSMRITRKEKK